MERIFANPTKTVTLAVTRRSLIVRETRGRRVKARTRTFGNRYALRKALTSQVAELRSQGFVSVNR